MMDELVEIISRQLDFNMIYAKRLVVDLNDKMMTHSCGAGLENHPAWTLGHLITGAAMNTEDLGGEFIVPNGYEALFLRKGPGDPRKPDTNTALYPKKEELLVEFERQHERLKLQLQKASSLQFNTEIKWRFAPYLPKTRDLIVFMCTSHESMHLGQLAAWRRAMNLPSALGSL